MPPASPFAQVDRCVEDARGVAARFAHFDAIAQVDYIGRGGMWRESLWLSRSTLLSRP